MFTEQRRYGRDPSVVTRCSDSTFYAPLRSKKWRELAPGSLVFTCSWSDWFHEDADEWRDEAWEVLRGRPDLNWQILTKRPERIAEHLPSDWGDGWPNVWLGVSIENRRFVGRADVLRSVPAAVRFISAEPLLGPLTPLLPGPAIDGKYVWWNPPPDYTVGRDDPGLDLSDIDWLICGGESGPQHRPIRISWVRSLLDACLAPRWVWRDGDIIGCRDDIGTRFFFKQWGGARPTSGGRELDGRTWDEFPQAREMEIA
jgi:protein gp37